MNTFATLLLAFPFYLAMKGRLSAYIALAKPDASGSVASSQAPTASGLSMTGSPAAPHAPNAPTAPTVGSATDMANVASNVTHIFEGVATLAGI